MKINEVNFTEHLDLILCEKGKTRTDLCNYLGVERSRISSWKYKKKFPTVSFCLKIADYLNVSLDYLLKDEK